MPQASAGSEDLTSQAFSLPFKLLAASLTVGCMAWLLKLGHSGVMASDGSSTLAWFAAAIALMAWTLWHIVRSETRLNASRLYQSWIWDKQMALSDMAYAKLIRARGLGWLVAPRLYVRTLEGKFLVFYASEPAMIAEFERLEQKMAQLHRQR